MKKQPINPNDQFDPDDNGTDADDALNHTADISVEELDNMLTTPDRHLEDESGEQTLSGDAAGLETDDDTFQNMKDVGLIDQDVSREDQPELDIAKEIEEAEKYHRDN